MIMLVCRLLPICGGVEILARMFHEGNGLSGKTQQNRLCKYRDQIARSDLEQRS